MNPLYAAKRRVKIELNSEKSLKNMFLIAIGGDCDVFFGFLAMRAIMPHARRYLDRTTLLPLWTWHEVTFLM
jgi:hypothetical protein